MGMTSHGHMSHFYHLLSPILNLHWKAYGTHFRLGVGVFPVLSTSDRQTLSIWNYMPQQPLCLPELEWEREETAAAFFFPILYYGSWTYSTQRRCQSIKQPPQRKDCIGFCMHSSVGWGSEEVLSEWWTLVVYDPKELRFSNMITHPQ